ncbi:hypothetical protein C8C85_0810 [Flavobacterium sp. 103]|uniref:hypothetical protein n=1 Tax=Flavobacterium sp. 103 TaxID=2135624 RepID=UPI000D5ECE27|nr:hypothetical protein [Flavobacterium sp. 103]PVX45046.1 hypothetical protein C8C85_0810 [Flavobacterium sp. 103]
MSGIFKIVKKSNNKIQFLILVIFVLFTSSTVFAQKSDFSISSNEVAINQNGSSDDTTPVRVSTSESNSNMNFILWFMGTKEDVNGTISNDSSYSKKSVITSGREPNHLLIKTLLKKAINIKSC